LLFFIRNIYSIAKPLLGLILLNESKFFNEIKQQLLFGHSQVKQNNLSNALDNLMTGIDRNLAERNKENFTQNLVQFRNETQEATINADEAFVPLGTTSSSTGPSIHIPVTIVMSNMIPVSASGAATEDLMNW
jgi:hypothetical protein